MVWADWGSTWFIVEQLETIQVKHFRACERGALEKIKSCHI